MIFLYSEKRKNKIFTY